MASFPSFGGKRQVSSGGGCQAHWRKDGKELFYLDLKGKLMAVDLTTDPTIVASAPRLLFRTLDPCQPRGRSVRGDRGRQTVHPRQGRLAKKSRLP